MNEASEWRDGMPFFGGALWIDFLNTTPMMNGETIDFLADADGLAKWARAAGIDCSAQALEGGAEVGVGDARGAPQALRQNLVQEKRSPRGASSRSIACSALSRFASD